MLQKFLKEPILDVRGNPFHDRINKFLQFDCDSSSGGVYMLNDFFITHSKNNGHKSVLTIVNNIQTFQHSNWELCLKIFTEIEKGNKIIITKLSDNYTEHLVLIKEREANLCNISGTSKTKTVSTENYIINKKKCYYTCLLLASKYIKKHSREPFIISPVVITKEEFNYYQKIRLGSYVHVRIKDFVVDKELHKLVKREKRISIINELL